MILRARSPRPRQVAALLVAPGIDLARLNDDLWAADALGVLPYALVPVSRPRPRISTIAARLRGGLASPSGGGFASHGEYRS